MLDLTHAHLIGRVFLWAPTEVMFPHTCSFIHMKHRGFSNTALHFANKQKTKTVKGELTLTELRFIL